VWGRTQARPSRYPVGANERDSRQVIVSVRRVSRLPLYPFNSMVSQRRHNVLRQLGLLAVGWLLTGQCAAQTFGPAFDPVRRDSLGHRPVNWTLNLDFRDSFIARRHVNVWGVNAGVMYGEKRHQITAGYYWLSYNSYLRFINWRRDAARRLNLAYYTKTDMAYGSLMYWWNLTNNRQWTVSFPVEAGAGVASAVPVDPHTEVSTGQTRRDFFMPVQVGVYGQWKASRWVGFSAQWGYRHSIFRTNLKQHYDGTYYSVGAVMYPELLRDGWHRLAGRKSRSL